MIKLRTLLETIELTPKGDVKIPDINEITPEQWEKINRIIIQKGHAMRGADDCKRAVESFIQRFGIVNHELFPRWVETLTTVLKLKPVAKEKTPLHYDPKQVLRAAARIFGLTHNLNVAGYILPNGGLLKLTGQGVSRDLDHREIASVYHKLKIKIPEDEHHSGTVYMNAFVHDCKAIRIGGSQPQVNVYNMPTRQQGNQLVKFFSMYDGEINLDVVSSEWGHDGRRYSKGTRPARILRDIIVFFETGELPNVPSTQNPYLKENVELDELKMVNLSKGDKHQYVLVFRSHLFLLDGEKSFAKVKAALKGHPAAKDINKNDDFWEFLTSAAESAPDILVGDWYPDQKKFLVWNHNEIIPQTSLQVKKAAKALGAKHVTYRYTDYVGKSYDTVDKELSIKKIKGAIPKVMFHGTVTPELKSILKYGLDPDRGPGRFIDRDVVHTEYVFVAATLEAAQFYADNAFHKSDKTWGKYPIIIELEIPDPNLLVPDYDADVSVTSKPTYDRPVDGKNPTLMKAMGVSLETGKWGYKGRIPAHFIKWVHYYNHYEKKWHKSNPDVWRKLLDKYDWETIGFKLGMYGYGEDDKPKYSHMWE